MMGQGGSMAMEDASHVAAGARRGAATKGTAGFLSTLSAADDATLNGLTL
jgi:hypothetical protein